MKHCLVTFAALLVAASSYAQGTVNFVNKITGTLDAKVLMTPSLGATPVPATGLYQAQLYGGPVGGALAPVGAPIAFRSDAGVGYWKGEARTIPGVAEGGTAQVQVVAWAVELGNDYAKAKAGTAVAGKSGGWGESKSFTMVTGGGLATPTAMVGLEGFTTSAIIPEPSIAALGLLGAGLLLIRRKK